MAGAGALVLAVWGALELSTWLTPQPAANPRTAAVVLPTSLTGFRPDLWYLPDDELLGFVEIPAGPFTMGSDPSVDSLAFDLESWGEEQTQGRVLLPAFYMGRFEVTVAQFAAFVSVTGYRAVDERALRGPPDHPVVWVSWTDTVAYTRWLDGELRTAGSLPELAALIRDGWRVRLPTEAEWEKTARGIDGRIYPWGDTPDPDRANYRSRATVAVGSIACPACAYGLSDMSGNVWEWTRSPYQPYPYDDSDDRLDLDTEALWVMRGGSFGDGEQHVRAANRGGADPGARRPFIGFRIALSRF